MEYVKASTVLLLTGAGKYNSFFLIFKMHSIKKTIAKYLFFSQLFRI